MSSDGTDANGAAPAEARLAAVDADTPFIASDGGFWRERYASVSLEAFKAGRPCSAYPERPLRALLVGHNPCAQPCPAASRRARALVLLPP
jgi:hypothetical protein